MRLVVLAVVGLFLCGCASTAASRTTRTVEIVPGDEAAPILVCAEARGRWVCMDWASFEASLHSDEDGAVYRGKTKTEPQQLDL